MQKKIIWLLISFLMVLSLVLVSCGEEEEEEEEVITPPGEEEEVIIPPEEEEVVVPPGGDWWDKFGEPQYGGTFTFRTAGDIASFDPWRGGDMTGIRGLYLEHPSQMDWALDRDIWSYQPVWVPTEYYRPCLAESWEQPDNETVILHVRQGVHWHNKPPMNGREMTADDIVWSWHRLSGMGSGFTEPSPYVWMGGLEYLKSITATDKYTLVLKATEPTFEGLLLSALDTYNVPTQPREVIETYGDMQDWKNACGTGPFMLVDYVAGASATLDKNPNYWGWDERHPENQVPYVDNIKVLIIPDQSTAYAALRTGKIDMISGINWEQAVKLLETNPELQSLQFLESSEAIQVVVTNEPFNDIRVRKALNMAIDRELVADSYYGGYVEGKAYGVLSPILGELYTPFEEWPKDLQAEYTYNPEGAIQLLIEAGYPEGFQTSAYVSSAANLDLVQVVQSMFADIGVDFEIKLIEATAFFDYVTINRKADQMFWGGGCCGYWDPGPRLDYFTAGHFLNAQNAYDDFTIDSLHQAAVTFDKAEAYRLWKAVDMHVMEQHWLHCLPPPVSFTIWQPWLLGYSGENLGRFRDQQYSRWWIDHDVKKAMGYE